MTLYVLAPIDNWIGWHDPRRLFTVDIDPGELEAGMDADSWIKAWREARREAALCGWEGDIRLPGGGPYVAVLPDKDLYANEPWFMIGWKQDNDGTTFIWSPVLLPWLGEPEVP